MLTKLASIILALAIGLAGLTALTGCVNINVKDSKEKKDKPSE